MYKTLFVLATTVVLLLGSGCRRVSRDASPSNAQISLTAIPFPAAMGQSRLVIRVMDPAGKPISDAALFIKGDMNHVGMVPVLAEVQGGDEGGYYHVPIEWTMAGDWVVTVEAALSDGTRAKKRFDLVVITQDNTSCTDDNLEGKPAPTNTEE